MSNSKLFMLGIIFFLFTGLSACSTGKKPKEDLAAKCCKECREAFSQSPVGVGAEGAECGAFQTGKPLSSPCAEYFKTHKTMVADCK